MKFVAILTTRREQAGISGEAFDNWMRLINYRDADSDAVQPRKRPGQ
jgi:hypothetical protein